jgi:diguanylate cyclase (GGDEF)-like protein
VLTWKALWVKQRWPLGADSGDFADNKDGATRASQMRAARRDMSALLERLGLRFGTPGQERAFRVHYAHRSLGFARVAIGLGLVLYGSFGILDLVVAPELKLELWIIRFGGVCPVILACLILSLLRPRTFEAVMQPLLGAVVLTAGLGIVAMTALCGPPASSSYYAGLMLVLTYGYVLSRLRFVAAAVVGGIIVFAYEVVAVFVNPVPVTVLVSNNFFFLSTNIMGMVAGFLLERLARQNFADLQTIHELSTRDHLTGLYNRRHLDRRLDELTSMYRRYGTVGSLLLVDLDGFKEVNDRFGHQSGDLVLRRVAQMLVGLVRETDLVFRYGGDEFCVVMPSTDARAAKEIGERFQRALADRPIQIVDEEAVVCLSGGCVSVGSGTDSADAMIARADEQLLKAKRGGKGRILSTPPPPPSHRQ